MKVRLGFQDGFPCKEIGFRFSFHILPKLCIASFDNVWLGIDVAWLFWRIVIEFKR